MQKGILTVASAGNEGILGSVVNHAPWLLTVAASGIDREFRSKVHLGNGKNILGLGVSTFNPKQELYPLIGGADAARDSASKEDARFCVEDTLDPIKVKNRLVYCKLGAWGTDSVVRGIGGVGTIVEADRFLDAAQIFMAPATMVNGTIGEFIDDYIHSTRSPSAVIYKTHERKKEPAPFVASFSSRGPCPGSQRLLKPDIAAPGVDILAAYTLMKSLTGLKGDTQFSEFSIMSGTSMACPHVAGVAAYVKPSSRMVLLKGFDKDGFVWYTNYESRKARELSDNSHASLLFYWDGLNRQVRVEGSVQKVSDEESEQYFHSRPRGSQLGAIVSKQSTVVLGRHVLRQQYKELEEKFSDGSMIPKPKHWGGYRLQPELFEFWQGQQSRLHDRLLYSPREVDGQRVWNIERLAP